jgi:hypothetical protein
MHTEMGFAVDEVMDGVRFRMEIVFSREVGEDLIEAVRQDY